MPVTLRRMGAHWPVFGAVLVTVLVSATLAGALAVFAGQAVPQAVHQDLATAPDTSVLVSGSVTESQLAPDTQAIRADMRSAFGTVPFAFDTATWSAPLSLPAGPNAGPNAGITGLNAALSTTRAPLVELAAAEGIQANSVLTSGQWPAPPRPGQPIPAALPAATAGMLHVSVGDVLTLRATGTGKPVQVLLTGEFRPRDPRSEYWRLDLIGVSGIRTSTQSTTYGPLIVDPATFAGTAGTGTGTAGTGTGTAGTGQSTEAAASASWLAIPGTAAIPDADLAALAGQITQEQQLLLDSATLGELTMATNLPALLGGMASNVVVADSLLAIGGLLLLLLDATALVLAARLLASQRQVESAQVSARGGARWQLIRLNVAEGAAVAVLAMCGGVLAGGRLAALLARTGPLRAAGLRISPVTPGEVLAAVVTSVICVVLMLGYPLLGSPGEPGEPGEGEPGKGAPGKPAKPAKPGQPPKTGEAWLRRGRQAAISRTARAGVDVALIALGAVAVWELRRYSAVAPDASGGLSVDPVLALAPALALAGGTVVLLRLVPAAARAGDRLASRGRWLTAPLASWQISRRAVSQAGVALLVVLAVATGMLALSQHQSWQRSVRDQAAFTAGADVRVDTPAPAVNAAQGGAIATAPGVRDAMPAAQLGYGDTGQAVAIDASKAADVVLLRPDLSKVPAAALFGRITPAGPPPGIGIPGRPARVELDANLAGATPAAVTLSIQDADGNVYAVPAGTLPDDGRTHALIANVARAVYPLRLLAVTARYPLPAGLATPASPVGPAGPAGQQRQATLAIASLADSEAASGPFNPPFAKGTALSAWQPAASSPDLADLLQSPGSTTGPARLPSAGTWRATAEGAQELSFSPGFGTAVVPTGQPGTIAGELALIAQMPVPPAIPGIATQAYLDAANVAVGAIVQISVTGVTVPVRIVAAVTAFPAMSGSGGAVIVDLAALQETLTAMSLPPAPVSEWWLSTGPAAGLPAGPPAGLTARLPPGSALTVPGQLAASMLGDPLSAAPQQAMLAIAVAAAVLALAGVAVSIAANISERQAQSALLSALGVSRSAQARQLCLEELMLSGPAAVMGLALGAVLGWLLVPAVTLTAGAGAPVPAALTELAWSRAVPLAAAVATLPVLVAAVTVARRPDPAARMRIAEAT